MIFYHENISKEAISPAAIIKNPAYQSSFRPETAQAVDVSERIYDKVTMREFVMDEDPLRHFWTSQHSFFTQTKKNKKRQNEKRGYCSNDLLWRPHLTS